MSQKGTLKSAKYNPSSESTPGWSAEGTLSSSGLCSGGHKHVAIDDDDDDDDGDDNNDVNDDDYGSDDNHGVDNLSICIFNIRKNTEQKNCCC